MNKHEYTLWEHLMHSVVDTTVCEFSYVFQQIQQNTKHLKIKDLPQQGKGIETAVVLSTYLC